MSFRKLGEPFNKLGSVLGQAARNIGALFPIIINFDGDESKFFDGGWLEGGGNVTNDQLSLGGELLTNEAFADWTADDPDGWTVSGESGADPEVSEVGTGEGNGGAGTGSANLFTSGGTGFQPLIQQSVLTIGNWIQTTVDISRSGSLRMRDTGNGLLKTYTTTGNKLLTGKAKAAPIEWRQFGASGNITLDSCSAQTISLVSILNALKSKFQVADGFFIDISINAVTADTQTGVMWNLDDEANPQNFGLAYMDSINLVVIKRVAGTYTDLASVAQAITADQILRIENPTGSNVLDILYNGVSLATPTISDAGVISNGGIALFSTEVNNAISRVEIGLL